MTKATYQTKIEITKSSNIVDFYIPSRFLSRDILIDDKLDIEVYDYENPKVVFVHDTHNRTYRFYHLLEDNDYVLGNIHVVYDTLNKTALYTDLKEDPALMPKNRTEAIDLGIKDLLQSKHNSPYEYLIENITMLSLSPSGILIPAFYLLERLDECGVTSAEVIRDIHKWTLIDHDPNSGYGYVIAYVLYNYGFEKHMGVGENRHDSTRLADIAKTSLTKAARIAWNEADEDFRIFLRNVVSEFNTRYRKTIITNLSQLAGDITNVRTTSCN